MIPTRFRPETRRDVPLGLLLGGAIALILLAFLAWVGVGMFVPPAQQTLTVDVPLAR